MNCRPNKEALGRSMAMAEVLTYALAQLDATAPVGPHETVLQRGPILRSREQPADVLGDGDAELLVTGASRWMPSVSLDLTWAPASSHGQERASATAA